MSRFASEVLRLLIVFVLAVLAVTASGAVIAPQLASLSKVTEASAQEVVLNPLSQRSYVYDVDGRQIGVLRADENRESVPLGDVPQHVVDAILAVEDAEFYSHGGVNVRSTFRALLSNVESGAISQGGSTITQQLVKQNLLGSQQDFERKTKEAFLAMRLERRLSKDEILEQYLNTVYFGNSAYGVQAASETYFGKDVGDINVGQAALLAGIIRDPIDYNPFADPDTATERRRIALNRLVSEGKITDEVAARHDASPLPDRALEIKAPPRDYFVEEVTQRLLDDVRLGETATDRYDAIFRGGLRIKTTLNSATQNLAIEARNDVLSPFAIETNPALFIAGVERSSGEDKLGTAAVATVVPETGAVAALVGGPGFDNYKFNLATQGYRQPGSAFKVLVLLTLLEQGYAPQDTVSGRGPCSFKIPGVKELYKVQNFGNSRGFQGSISSMTTNSSNCGYLRLGQVAGIPNVVELAGRLGLDTRNAANEIVPLSPEIFSTPLGTQEVTPLAMAAASAAIMNDGCFNEPYFIQRVEDRNGQLIFEHEASCRQVFSKDTAAIAADILRRNVTGGTGTRARVPEHETGGKTGTAQDFSNAWFVGFTEQYSTAVWMGAMIGQIPMRRVGGRSVTGGSYPAMIFGQYMSGLHLDLAPAPFPDVPSRRGTGLLRVDKDIDIRPSYTPRPTTPRTTAAPPPTTQPPVNGNGNGNGENKGSTPPSTAAPPPIDRGD